MSSISQSNTKTNRRGSVSVVTHRSPPGDNTDSSVRSNSPKTTLEINTSINNHDLSDNIQSNLTQNINNNLEEDSFDALNPPAFSRNSSYEYTTRNAFINVPCVPIFLTPNDDIGEVLEYDSDLKMLRSHITEEFTEKFKEGFNNYIHGAWVKAKAELEKANNIMKRNCPSSGGDGPSQTLLKYMESFNYSAPKTWKGFRPLTSK